MAIYLVTGGAGFIGSHIVDGLLERGQQVRVLDNFDTGKADNLAHCRDRIELIEGDIRDLETCREVCEGVDFVLHQASSTAFPNLPRISRQAGFKRHLYGKMLLSD